MLVKTRFIESEPAFELFACTMATYTRLKGKHPDLRARELRERRQALRNARYRARQSIHKDCGEQDRAVDALEWAAASFAFTLNAMKLLRGTVSPKLQRLVLESLGDA